MKTGKWCAIGLVVLTVWIADSAYSSTFRLKNVPEAYARLEGAIVEEDTASITIMTQDNVLVKDRDSIEIVQRTPAEDKQFIAQYGPSNAVYQEYLKQKNKLPVTPAAETKSAAQPGEKFLLRYRFNKGETSYLIYHATGEITTKTGKLDVPVGNNIKIIKTILTRDISPDGFATLLLGTNLFIVETQTGANRRKVDQTSQFKGKGETVEYDSRGVRKTGENFLKATLEGGTGSATDQINQFLFTVLPGKEIAIGERWTDELKYDIPGGGQPFVFQIESVLDDVIMEDGAKVALITTTTSLNVKDFSLDPQKAGVGSNLPQYAGQKITIQNMTMRQVAKSRFGIERGQLSTVNESSDIQISMTLPGNQTVVTGIKMEATRTYTKQKPS